MTTAEVETRLMYHFDYVRNLIIPTINSVVMFEADLLVLTPAGYATVVEIKVSKADLRNDLKKRHISLLGEMVYGKTCLERYYRKIKYFYYAVPEELKDAALEQIPEFAGLIVLKKVTTNRYGSESSVIVAEIVRHPKLLFNYKWSLKEMYNVARLGTIRIAGLKSTIAGNLNDIKYLREKLKNYENSQT